MIEEWVDEETEWQDPTHPGEFLGSKRYCPSVCLYEFVEAVQDQYRSVLRLEAIAEIPCPDSECQENRAIASQPWLEVESCQQRDRQIYPCSA